MRARRKWILLLIGLIVVGTVVWNLTRERERFPEPVHQGKTLSDWLTVSIADDTRAIRRIGTNAILTRGELDYLRYEAVRQIGTNAIPFLLKWIAYEPPSWGYKIAQQIANLPDRLLSTPAAQRKISGQVNEELSRKAMYAFKALGPAAAPAAPKLIRIAVSTKNEMTRNRTQFALSYIGTPATPALLATYGRTTETNRAMIATLLDLIWFPATANGAPPEFIREFFIHPDPRVRQGATNFALDHAPGLLTNSPSR